MPSRMWKISHLLVFSSLEVIQIFLKFNLILYIDAGDKIILLFSNHQKWHLKGDKITEHLYHGITD